MGVTAWTWVFVVLTFGLYITIAWRSRVKDTKGFYVAGQGVPAVANGAAVAADWMSAASFISMAGIVAFAGYDGSVFLMGWTGGYVLLALLLAPYLRRFGKFTVPDFVGDRYSETARLVAVVAAIFVSFTYVVGQMRGVGVVFGRFLGVSVTVGVVIGMLIVLFYAVLGGMKGITWTQVAQYTVLIIAYMIPAVAIAYQLTGNPIPHVSFGDVAQNLNAIQADLGFDRYTEPFTQRVRLDVLLVTASLMIGTAGLPHVIVRFYTTKDVRSARWSAFYALAFIAILYTTAPAIGVFAKFNLLETVTDTPRAEMPAWFDSWEETGLLAWDDLDGDGNIQFTGDDATNELTVDQDIMVLATPEVAGLPAPVIGLVAAGGLAAALSTASGLLLVISSSVAHDFYYKRLRPGASEQRRLNVGRGAMAVGVVIAGYFGVNPPGFVAEVVALAFGLAAASFFPVIVLGIFWKRTNARGAVAGMICGLGLTAAYMGAVLYGGMEPWFGVSAEGAGAIGALINLVVTVGVTMTAPPPDAHLQELVERVRYPGSQPVHEEVAPPGGGH
ncbi:cation acetate symporter [Nitriliruptoraceae bacterium ZYF776]|nr:cation acetate symporter [Profundirhabdus halotolerans]